MTRGTGAKLIIVCGLPGAGKTTHARLLEAKTAAVRLCPDEWMGSLALNLYDEDVRARIETLQWSLGQKLLTLGQTVIIEWGTWSRSEREALRLRARELGAAVELHYLTAPADVLFERVGKRGIEDLAIQRDDLLRWVAAFEVPSTEELERYDQRSM